MPASAISSEVAPRRARPTAGRRRGAARWPALALWLLAGVAVAEVYEAPRAFLDRAFTGSVPAPRVLWITRALRPGVRAILGHDLGVLRLRYWARGTVSAWILEEIGKERPITVGIVVDAGRITRLAILEYRESRGWEVRRRAFTRQFDGAGPGAGDGLDRRIDGITGATLSVRAVRRLARLALFLAAHAAETAPGRAGRRRSPDAR